MNGQTEAGSTMFSLFQRQRGDGTIPTLYGVIVAQARQPEFYASYGVPDTLEGRFDMIVLHLALLVRRLRSAEAPVRDLSQGVFDHFCGDMDHNLRELGLSDMAVPRRMRKFGEAFYGRATAYDRALGEEGDDALSQVLARNVFGKAVAGAEVAADGTAGDLAAADPAASGAGHEPAGWYRLAAYMRAADRELEGQNAAEIAAGRLRFPITGEIMAATGRVSARGPQP